MVVDAMIAIGKDDHPLVVRRGNIQAHLGEVGLIIGSMPP
jgi:hypothetical protein